MTVVLFVIIGIVLAFGLVVLVGPPYLPTMREQITTALDLLDLKPGQTMLEIGAGDGRVLVAAARRGWKVVGIELNPILVLIARIRTWRYRKQVRVVWGNCWQVTWPDADGIFTFLLQRHMQHLDARIMAMPKKPVRLASFAFTIPGRKPRKLRKGIFLYEYR